MSTIVAIASVFIKNKPEDRLPKSVVASNLMSNQVKNLDSVSHSDPLPYMLLFAGLALMKREFL